MVLFGVRTRKHGRAARSGTRRPSADADLAAGNITMACQRPRGLVGSFPDRPDLRARLAQAYRMQGNQVQAGRWDYLADNPGRRRDRRLREGDALSAAP